MKPYQWITGLLILSSGLAFGQGSLTPPGAPAATMKTLSQLDAAIVDVNTDVANVDSAVADVATAIGLAEPRTPLVVGSPGVSIGASGTITITQSGSYYLTENLTVTSGDGITINASGVTVDLQGFTIRSTLATAANEGIDINGSSVSIFNGHIVSGVLYDSGASGDQYTGSGFAYGIYASSSYYIGIRIRDLSVSGCNLNGIYTAGTDSLVESCTVKTVGGYGVKAGIVNNCVASICGGTAIYGTSVTDCRGSSTGGDGIYATVVANSYGYTTSTATSSEGIHASSTVQNSYGFSKGGDAIYSGGTVANSLGYTSSSDLNAEGIHGYITVQNSYGKSTGSDGIYSGGTVADSYGYSTSTATSSEGIYGSKAVQNSYGYSTGGDGIRTPLVSYSYGYSTGSDAGSVGIDAVIATSCYAIGGQDIDYKYNMP